jgi:molybdopterin molybdotransferase
MRTRSVGTIFGARATQHNMISVEEALQSVLKNACAKAPVTVSLEQALGCVLAEDITSDLDSPPHDKSLVDGYAVLAADAQSTPVELIVGEEVMAGEIPSRPVTSGTATRIMTGAPIPAGADAIVMVEQTELVDGDAATVRLAKQPVQVGQHIMRRATSLQRGDVVLTRGARLRPIEIGLLAEVGRPQVSVFPSPNVAVLSTGNELVPVDECPAAGQIRNSNGPMLGALVQRAGGRHIDLGIGRDEQNSLAQLVGRGLEADVLVLSGGVSAGALDLVPGVLAERGVDQVFHKVDLKPGKPIWFGVLADPNGDKLVFGLPGNPVSSLVCFELFVRPAMVRLAGGCADRLPTQLARLTNDHRHRGDRPTYFPSRLRCVDGQSHVELLAWKGSADLRSLSSADCLAFFPKGERAYRAGDEIDVVLFP